MTKQVEFFYDLSSPWTCLAFHNIQPIIAETNANIIWRPFLVGGVFNAVNKSVYAGREDMNNPKMRFFLKSLKDWANWSAVTLNFPSKHHPVKSVYAMRACCALEDNQDVLFRFSKAAFNAYYTDQKNLDDSIILAEIAESIGLDSKALIAKSQSDEIKLKLRTNTEEAIKRGSFGSPSIFVGGDNMFFGNDQLPLVKHAIKHGL